MSDPLPQTCTAFDGTRRLATGPLAEVAPAVKARSEAGAAGPMLTFDDATGRVVDLDLRGTPADVVGRLAPPPPEARGRGRPKLGVVAREVTLLPRHWDWLATQPGGASVALRKLVEDARRTGGERQRVRAAQEAAYAFTSALAGDLPGYEDAIRALFANDRDGFERCVAGWPDDVKQHAVRLAFAPAVSMQHGERSRT